MKSTEGVGGGRGWTLVARSAASGSAQDGFISNLLHEKNGTGVC